MLELILGNFEISEHRFLIMADKEYVAKHYPVLLKYNFPCVFYLKKPSGSSFKAKIPTIRNVAKQMKQADVIVWHSLMALKGAYGFPLSMLCAKNGNLKKSVWVEHATDLLYWKNPFSKNLKEKIKNYLQKYIRDNISYIGLTIPSDKAIHSSAFGGTYKYFDLPTPPSVSHVAALEEAILDRSEEDRERLALLIQEAVNAKIAEIKAFRDKKLSLERQNTKAYRRHQIEQTIRKTSVWLRGKNEERYNEKDAGKALEEETSLYEDLPWYERVVRQAEAMEDAKRREEETVDVPENNEEFSSYEDLVEKISASTKLPPRKPVILLGYDGLTYNDHKGLIDKLKLLKGHRNQITELYVPMHYTMFNEDDIPSSDAYRKSISDYGVKVLDFRPKLLNSGSVTEKDYFKFLNNVDIAVFGGHRPLNADMLLYLLYMGKKIFLPTGTFLTKFLKEQGVPVEENDSLNEMTFEDFIKPPCNMEIGQKWAKSCLNYEEILVKWQNFFDYFKNKPSEEIAFDKCRIKYLYLFFGTQRTMGGYWKMIGQREDSSDHKFIIPRTTAIIKWVPELAYRDDIIYLPNKNLWEKLKYIYRIYSNSDNIIIHGMFVSTFMYIPLILFRKFRNRLAWIEWTGDIWIWKKPNTSLKNRLINKVNKRLREIMPYIVMTAPTDEERFKSEFTKSTAKCVYIPLPSKRETSPVIGIESAKPEELKSPEIPVRIQIAHNVFKFNRHIDIMKMLERFKDENIELFLPLAYGEGGLNGEHGGWDYINTVKSYAKLSFGDRVILHTKPVSLEDYTKLLWQVDVAIFGSERMAGAANIYMLLYMGKKVYMPGGCAYYEFFKSKGLKVFDLNKIPEMSYEEFIRPVKNQDVSWIAEQYDQEKTAKLWDAFFKDLDARHKK